MRKRDFLKNKAQQSKDQSYWAAFRAARNEVNNAIKYAKRKYFDDNLAEAFNCHFANIRLDLAKDIHPTVKEPEYYLNPTNKTFSLNSCSTSEVQKLLENLEVKKATGLDNLLPKLLKLAVGILAPSLTFIFNQSLSSGIVPLEWKLAKVTPIFKKGKRQDVNGYRPISIIPVVVKVFERIIYDQFYKYLNDNDLLANCQSGFRSLHSTLFPCLRLLTVGLSTLITVSLTG